MSDGIDGYDLKEVPGHLLRRAQQRAVEIYLEEVGAGGVRPRQFAVLLTVYQNPGLNQTDLGQLTGIDRSTVAEMVARLVGRGLLRRKRTPRDQRANSLLITETGIQVLCAALAGVNRAQERILAPLPPHVRDTFIHCLKQVADLPEQVDLPTGRRSSAAAG